MTANLIPDTVTLNNKYDDIDTYLVYPEPQSETDYKINPYSIV